MQKSMNLWILVVALASFTASGATVNPCTEQERAYWGGATHVVNINYSDLTETTTNTAQTLTNVFAIASNKSVTCVAMVLDKAFTVGTDTNYTGSTLLEIGDGTDADLYLTSTELNVDNGPTYVKIGRASAYTLDIVTPTITYMPSNTHSVSRTTITTRTNAATIEKGTIVYTNATTNTITCVTNVIFTWSDSGVYGVITNFTSTATALTFYPMTNATLTGSTYGVKTYSANDYIDFKFTPNTEESLSQLTAGSLRIYFRVHK